MSADLGFHRLCDSFQLSKGCSLHLAQRWSQLFNIQLRRMPILSKDSAPGLIMATGSITLQYDNLKLMKSFIKIFFEFRLFESEFGPEWRLKVDQLTEVVLNPPAKFHPDQCRIVSQLY